MSPDLGEMEGGLEVVAQLPQPLGQRVHSGLRGRQPQLEPGTSGYGGPDPHSQHLLPPPGGQQRRHLRDDRQLCGPRLSLRKPNGHQPSAPSLGQEPRAIIKSG